MSSVDWPEKETLCLIEIWKEYLPELRAQKRNAHVYAKITLQLTEEVEREFTSKQVATKIKNLLRQYQKEKSKLVTGSAPSKWKFYNIINAFLCCLPSNNDSLIEESFLNNGQFKIEAMQDEPSRSGERPQSPALDAADRQPLKKKGGNAFHKSSFGLISNKMSTPSRRTSSNVWYHFTKQERTARCHYCQQTLACSSGFTSNLKRHLRLKHPTVPLQRSNSGCRSRSSSSDRKPEMREIPLQSTSNERESQSITSPLFSSGSGSASSPKPDFCFPISSPPIPLSRSMSYDTQLLKMICKEFHPFSIVDYPEFKKLVNMLCPNYHLPSRKTLSNSLMPSLFNELFDKIKIELADAKAVCLTLDGWTNLNNVRFYALTAHFFNKSKMQSYLLECSQFQGSHTAENISNWVKSVTNNYNIHCKITAIVTDDATNMKAAAVNLNFRHIPCFAHSLNLIIQQSIKLSINDTVDEIKRTVMFFKKSTHATSKLAEMQDDLKKDKLKLKQDVPTRWNSTYDMLDRFFLNKDPIISTLATLEEKIFTLNVKDKDWAIIEYSLKILKRFEEVTIEMSSEKTVSLSKMKILLRLMDRQLRSFKEKNKDCPQEINLLLDNLLKGLSERFGDISNSDLVTQATLLDPRFKSQGFTDDSKYRECYAKLIAKLKTQIAQGANLSPKPTQPVAETALENESIWDEFDESVWAEFDESINKLQGGHNPGSAAIVELDQYLSESYIPRNSDPLSWWESRKMIYPTLYELALKRLCIPATSVPCEQIFSRAGQICNKKRNQLSSSKITQILYIKHNMD